MNKLIGSLIGFAVVGSAHGQFVYPSPNDHDPVPGVYAEDPFITKYRREYFAIFKGDVKRFQKAYGEVAAMVAKDPKDARALVWLGNGDTVDAAWKLMTGQKDAALKELEVSRKHLDAAVALKPDDPNVYMMRGVTLYLQGQYFPGDKIPKSVWEGVRDACLKLIGFAGKRMKDASVHVRCETYGELGIAYLKLGEKGKAREAFQTILKSDPESDYAVRARVELAKL